MDDPKQLEWIPIENNKLLYCKFHPKALQEDFIEIFIKKKNTCEKLCRFCTEAKNRIKLRYKQEWQKEKEVVTDYYVRRTLVMGKRAAKIAMHEYPQTLVEAKRAVIKLKRAAQDTRIPIKVCRNHGNLFEGGVVKAGKTSAGTQLFKCKECLKNNHRNYYIRNHKEVREKHAIYRKENWDKVLALKRAWVSKPENHIKTLARQKRYREANHEKERERKVRNYYAEKHELRDSYIKKMLVRDTALQCKDVPPALIEAKRALVKLKMELKSQRMLNKNKDFKP